MMRSGSRSPRYSRYSTIEQSQNDGKCVGKSLDNNFHNQLKQQQKGWIKNCNIITHLILNIFSSKFAVLFDLYLFT